MLQLNHNGRFDGVMVGIDGESARYTSEISGCRQRFGNFGWVIGPGAFNRVKNQAGSIVAQRLPRSGRLVEADLIVRQEGLNGWVVTFRREVIGIVNIVSGSGPCKL